MRAKLPAERRARLKTWPATARGARLRREQTTSTACRDDGLPWASVVCVGLVPRPLPRRMAPTSPTAVGAVGHATTVPYGAERHMRQ